jgi:hypothetical protein
MSSIAGYTVKNKKHLGHWEALMEEWMLCIERYSRTSDGDVPYWHNERANVGVLAGAAWRCGRIALEEFQYEKIDVSADEKTDNSTTPEQRKWNGRCDLWIATEKTEEVIEAKFKWLNLLSDKLDEQASTCLDAALKDAANTQGGDDLRAIGVAFLPIYAKASKVGDPTALTAQINAALPRFEKLPADLVAWSFPKRLRNHVGEAYNNYLPGVLLLAKAVR